MTKKQEIQSEDIITKHKEQVTKKNYKDTPKIGLINRTNYDIVVAYLELNNKNQEIIVSPSERTGKHYVEKNIKSINGMSFNTAISSGIVSIIR